MMEKEKILKLPLTSEEIKNEIRLRYHYDPDTGYITFKERTPEHHKAYEYFNNTYAGKIATKVRKENTGYVYSYLNFEYKLVQYILSAARVAWLLMTGDWPKHTIDHIDRDSTNNKWDNLRDVTQFENNLNKSAYSCNSTGYKGVNKMGNRFWARITVGRKTYRLGYHDTPEKAARAYDTKAIELLGDKAVLNFPTKPDEEILGNP